MVVLQLGVYQRAKITQKESESVTYSLHDVDFSVLSESNVSNLPSHNVHSMQSIIPLLFRIGKYCFSPKHYSVNCCVCK